ncbi:hypothetical protein [Bacillus velezensis]|uniref:hypothetical protein n=1 Tax=Bacillus velezensis TaxID=492670 RepID=UPI0018E757D5|nr:hypothetical protein [Bacillus velezensis]
MSYRISIVGELPDGTKLNFEYCGQDQELKDAAFTTVEETKKAMEDFKMLAGWNEIEGSRRIC